MKIVKPIMVPENISNETEQLNSKEDGLGTRKTGFLWFSVMVGKFNIKFLHEVINHYCYSQDETKITNMRAIMRTD